MRLLSLTAFTLLAGLAAIPAVAGDVADLVIVEKAERRMVLMRGDTVLRTYRIALGDAPVGHKRQEGDERTPEGRYVLDWRNEKSSFHKSIHVSYPDADDRAAATKAGVDPGGMIMIHGQPNGFGWWSWLLQRFDWTDGCIAVTDQEMDEIWAMVKNGTAIEIRP